jgi:putative phage-type endonuclease
MNATLLGTVGVDLTEEDWLAKRREGIGGSEAPAIAGAVDWASQMSVYLDKLGLTEPKEVNERMWWGSQHESNVIEAYEMLTGYTVLGRQEFYAHGEFPWMLATIDGYMDEAEDIPFDHELTENIFEGKTTGAWNGKNWKGDIPLHVYTQVQHDMAVTGAKVADVATLVGGNHLIVCTDKPILEDNGYPSGYDVLPAIHRDDVYISQLIALEEDFYTNHLVPQVPPAIDGSKASEDALKILFPTDDGTELTTDDPDAEDAIRRYLDYKQAVSEFEAKKRKAANEIKALLGDHIAGTISGKYRATWKTIERDAYEVKASSYRKLDVREMSDA